MLRVAPLGPQAWLGQSPQGALRATVLAWVGLGQPAPAALQAQGVPAAQRGQAVPLVAPEPWVGQAAAA